MNNQPPPAKSLFGRFWRGYLRQHLGLMLVALFLMMLEGSALGGLSYLLKPLFDRASVSRTEE